MAVSSALFDHFRQRFAGALAQGVQARVTADAGGEIRVCPAYRTNECVAAFLADLAVPIAAPVVEADVAVFLAHRYLHAKTNVTGLACHKNFRPDQANRLDATPGP